MKSKISCFNQTIFKKNLTLYWPLWTAWLLLLLAIVPVSLYQYMRLYTDNPLVRQYSTLRTVFVVASEPLIIFIFCIFAVMCVFSYLYTSKNTNGMHGLPVTRLELFVTNTISAFLGLAVPELISFIAGVFVGVSCGVTNIEVLLYLFLFQLGMTFFGIAFATVIAMLTGHILAMPVYCVIANYLYMIVREVLEALILSLTYGLNDLWGMDMTYVLSPFYYLSQSVSAKTNYNEMLERLDSIHIEGGGVVAGYAAAGIVLYLAAYLLYKKRHLETAGDIIAVGFMKPVFRIGLGVCGGMTLGVGLSELFYFDTAKYSDERFAIMLIFVLVCIFIGYFMAEMLMQKSFRIFKKKMLVESALTAVVVTVFLFALNVDAFGLESALPIQEEIAEVWTDLDYPVKYEGEEIAEILVVNTQIIAEKDRTLKEIADETVQCWSVTFKYVLKDGSVCSRNYSLPIDMENPANPKILSGQILAKEMEAERLNQYKFGVNYKRNRYVSGYISLYDQYQNYFEHRFTEEEVTLIAEALQKDIEEGNYAHYELYSISGSDMSTDEFMSELHLTYFNEEGIERIEDAYYQIPMHYDAEINGAGARTGAYAVQETASADTIFTGSVASDTMYVRFGKKCTNVIRTLEELGIVNETWHLYTHEEYNMLEINEK